MTFDEFFALATRDTAHPNGYKPFDYQRRLALDPKCQSRLIEIPTGLGKTAAVVLAWLWNRVLQPDEKARTKWPRRLVYCLPMRTLVEQTYGEAEKWLNAHELLWDEKPETHSGKVGLHVLMGGEDSGEWDLYPEREAILIGTQDMLLSRALNRGYGMSRYRWPMHFGLLNNDSLWVMDETQLMGPALWTSAQLDWMRHARFPTLFPCKTWWMSATVGKQFLKTSDRGREDFAAPPVLDFGDEPRALQQLFARRPCAFWSSPPLENKKSATKKTGAAEAGAPELLFAAALGRAVVSEHQPGTLSLVVCNTVATAQAVFSALKAAAEGNVQCILLTSRFRKDHRKKYLDALLDFEKQRKVAKGDLGSGLICVSTQVVEAGVDVSAVRLWSEIAPWPSLVQRLGRLNRDGRNDDEAKALFFTVPTKDVKPKKDAQIGPYPAETVLQGERIMAALVRLLTAQPDLSAREALTRLHAEGKFGKDIDAALQPAPTPYPRAMDVHGLFSTEPDVFGGFTDVSPWVRNADVNADASVFWRSFKPTDPDANAGDGPGLQADELCSVPVNRLRDLLGTSRRAWTWEPKKQRWEAIRPADLRPGMTVMLPVVHGGYEILLGWTGLASSKLEDIPPPGPFDDGDDDDSETQIGRWVALDTHLADTRKVAQEIASALQMPQPLETCLVQSAELHDIGKSLSRWQSALPAPHPLAASLFAKAPWQLDLDLTQNPNAADECGELIQRVPAQAILYRKIVSESEHDTHTLSLQLKFRLKRSVIDELEGILKARPKCRAFRPKCRHEAASAIAMWTRYYHGAESPPYPALAIYIVAAHHGKVRTALNSNPRVPGPNVCGIPSEDPQVLVWNPEWKLDFEAAVDGASGQFHDDGTFSFSAPGWTGLVADLLGGWEKDAAKRTCGAVPEVEPHTLGPFALAYFEALLRAADGRASANPSFEIAHVSDRV